LETWAVARPNITASTAVHPISMTRMTVRTITAMPSGPNTERRNVYCSRP
jgi:hypothetical protein